MPDPRPSDNHTRRRIALYRQAAGSVTGTVVDVGCGDGAGLPILHAAGARGVIGIDDDPVVVMAARARHATDSVEVVEADLTDLPLVNDTYDVVVSVHTLERMDEPALLVTEMARITHPGGTIVVATGVGEATPTSESTTRSGPTATSGSTTGAGPTTDDGGPMARLRAVMEAAAITVTGLRGLVPANDGFEVLDVDDLAIDLAGCTDIVVTGTRDTTPS